MPSYSNALFSPVSSFMGVPTGPDILASAPLACVVGIPFDCGTHPTRIGARQGPDAIREQSRLLRIFDQAQRAGVDNPIEFLRLVDAGNVICQPGDTEASFPKIEQAIDAIHSAGAVSIALGGDGAITLPQLRAVAKHFPDFVVLHLDAHTDTYPIPGYNTASTFTRAAEEGLMNVNSSFHVGARGYSFIPNVLEYGRKVGYQVISFDELDKNQKTVIKAIKQAIGERPVYLCFDMDIFDPSCAPGVCTPEWGGLSAKEGLSLLRDLMGLNFVAFDINTVSPPHDVQGATAFLAATIVQQCLELAVPAIESRLAACPS